MGMKSSAPADSRGELWGIVSRRRQNRARRPLRMTVARALYPNHAPLCASLLDRRTQWIVLSAAIKQQRIAERGWGTQGMLGVVAECKLQRHRGQQGCRRSSSTP